MHKDVYIYIRLYGMFANETTLHKIFFFLIQTKLLPFTISYNIDEALSILAFKMTIVLLKSCTGI